jgi:hypothetical protein
MKVALYTALVGYALLYAALMKFEMLTKTTRIETRRMQRLLLGDDDVRPAGRSAAPVA